MKRLLIIILTGGFLAAGAATVAIADFENREFRGWQGYKDAESAAPVLSIDTEEAISGEAALKVTLNGCKRYRGILYHLAPVLPEKATAVSFLIKPVSGAPPESLALAETEKRYGKSGTAGVARIRTNGNDWQKVTIRLDEMKYGSGPERGGKYPFKPGAVYQITFYGIVSDQPAVFLIDDLKWETE